MSTCDCRRHRKSTSSRSSSEHPGRVKCISLSSRNIYSAPATTFGNLNAWSLDYLATRDLDDRSTECRAHRRTIHNNVHFCLGEGPYGQHMHLDRAQRSRPHLSYLFAISLPLSFHPRAIGICNVSSFQAHHILRFQSPPLPLAELPVGVMVALKSPHFPSRLATSIKGQQTPLCSQPQAWHCSQ